MMGREEVVIVMMVLGAGVTVVIVREVGVTVVVAELLKRRKKYQLMYTVFTSIKQLN